MASLRLLQASYRALPSARFGSSFLGLGLLALAAGCSTSHIEDGVSLKQLGIDDGAAAGESTDERVDADEAAELSLATGAELDLEEDSVSETTRVGLSRVEDKGALKYLTLLDADSAVLSAPYAVTPFRDFERSVQLSLPIATRGHAVRVGFLMLDDEGDKSWRLLGEAEAVAEGIASMSIVAGGIYVAVNLDLLNESDYKPQDAGVKSDAGSRLDAGVQRDAGSRLDAGVKRDAQNDPVAPAGRTDKVDLLFMIDNSGSMAEEQEKLSHMLSPLVAVLTSGNKDGMPSTEGRAPEFAPPSSLHIGVVSSDMGVAGAPAQKSCGALSFIPTEQNTTTTNMFLNKPMGDDGMLQTSNAVAVSGIFTTLAPGGNPIEVVPGDPACATVTFPVGQRYIDYSADQTDAQRASLALSCITKLGKNGCGMEQQLESVLKALTPPDSQFKFSMNTNGQGTAIRQTSVSGPNANFLRDDAVLAIVFLSDEEDCSLPDSSRAVFDATSTQVAGEINVRCGFPENQRYLHSVSSRYVEGLKALKPAAYQDRIVVMSIVGMPVKENLGGITVFSGAHDIDTILARPDMQFKVQRNTASTADEPVPTCISAAGDGSAAPARRFLELTKAFGDNGLVTSICEDEYGSALQVLVDRIAAQLQ
jgi:hypothetical protein